MQKPSPLPENFFVHEEIDRAESLPPRPFKATIYCLWNVRKLFKNAWLMLPEPSRDSYANDPRSTTQRVVDPDSHARLLRAAPPPPPPFLKRDQAKAHCDSFPTFAAMHGIHW